MPATAASFTNVRGNDTAFRQGVMDARLGRPASFAPPSRARAAAYRAGRRAFAADPSVANSVVPNAA
jgi:hypothetical protein